ncbi:MAG: hypothetical protein ACO3FA_06395 [Vulcanococcus sp.]|jgi:hypothetical protein
MRLKSGKAMQLLLQKIETALIRRENVIRFLVFRTAVMLVMLIGFYVGVRHQLVE